MRGKIKRLEARDQKQARGDGHPGDGPGACDGGGTGLDARIPLGYPCRICATARMRKRGC
ncbi:MAG: hypothetical protein ACLVAT_12600 [Lachnospiraceae bacterium]